MNKTVLIFFIFLIFCGAIAFTGWTQLRVKPDSCGIIVSKLNGVNKKPVLPGKFYWNWEFLLPTNAEIKTFKIEPLNVTKTVSGTLPSGEIYSAIYNTNNNFEYKFTFSLSVTVSPDAVVKLYEENKITDSENLHEYLSSACDIIAQAVSGYYLKKLEENPNTILENIKINEILKSVQVYKEIPDVDIYLLSLSDSKKPDFVLYNRLKNRYLSEKSYSQSNNILNNNIDGSSYNDSFENHNDFDNNNNYDYINDKYNSSNEEIL